MTHAQYEVDFSQLQGSQRFLTLAKLLLRYLDEDSQHALAVQKQLCELLPVLLEDVISSSAEVWCEVVADGAYSASGEPLSLSSVSSPERLHPSSPLAVGSPRIIRTPLDANATLRVVLHVHTLSKHGGNGNETEGVKVISDALSNTPYLSKLKEFREFSPIAESQQKCVSSLGFLSSALQLKVYRHLLNIDALSSKPDFPLQEWASYTASAFVFFFERTTLSAWHRPGAQDTGLLGSSKVFVGEGQSAQPSQNKKPEPLSSSAQLRMDVAKRLSSATFSVRAEAVSKIFSSKRPCGIIGTNRAAVAAEVKKAKSLSIMKAIENSFAESMLGNATGGSNLPGSILTPPPSGGGNATDRYRSFVNHTPLSGITQGLSGGPSSSMGPLATKSLSVRVENNNRSSDANVTAIVDLPASDYPHALGPQGSTPAMQSATAVPFKYDVTRASPHPNPHHSLGPYLTPVSPRSPVSVQSQTYAGDVGPGLVYPSKLSNLTPAELSLISPAVNGALQLTSGHRDHSTPDVVFVNHPQSLPTRSNSVGLITHFLPHIGSNNPGSHANVYQHQKAQPRQHQSRGSHTRLLAPQYLPVSLSKTTRYDPSPHFGLENHNTSQLEKKENNPGEGFSTRKRVSATRVEELHMSTVTPSDNVYLKRRDVGSHAPAPGLNEAMLTRQGLKPSVSFTEIGTSSYLPPPVVTANGVSSPSSRDGPSLSVPKKGTSNGVNSVVQAFVQRQALDDSCFFYALSTVNLSQLGVSVPSSSSNPSSNLITLSNSGSNSISGVEPLDPVTGGGGLRSHRMPAVKTLLRARRHKSPPRDVSSPRSDSTISSRLAGDRLAMMGGGGGTGPTSTSQAHRCSGNFKGREEYEPHRADELYKVGKLLRSVFAQCIANGRGNKDDSSGESPSILCTPTPAVIEKTKDTLESSASAPVSESIIDRLTATTPTAMDVEDTNSAAQSEDLKASTATTHRNESTLSSMNEETGGKGSTNLTSLLVHSIPEPKVKVGFEGEQNIAVPYSALNSWDRASFSPVSSQKNVTYVVVPPPPPLVAGCLNDGSKTQIVGDVDTGTLQLFFEALSNTYEAANLGKHVPLSLGSGQFVLGTPPPVSSPSQPAPTASPRCVSPRNRPLSPLISRVGRGSFSRTGPPSPSPQGSPSSAKETVKPSSISILDHFRSYFMTVVRELHVVLHANMRASSYKKFAHGVVCGSLLEDGAEDSLVVYVVYRDDDPSLDMPICEDTVELFGNATASGGIAGDSRTQSGPNGIASGQSAPAPINMRSLPLRLWMFSDFASRLKNLPSKILQNRRLDANMIDRLHFPLDVTVQFVPYSACCGLPTPSRGPSFVNDTESRVLLLHALAVYSKVYRIDVDLLDDEFPIASGSGHSPHRVYEPPFTLANVEPLPNLFRLGQPVQIPTVTRTIHISYAFVRRDQICVGVAMTIEGDRLQTSARKLEVSCYIVYYVFPVGQSVVCLFFTHKYVQFFTLLTYVFLILFFFFLFFPTSEGWVNNGHTDGIVARYSCLHEGSIPFCASNCSEEWQHHKGRNARLEAAACSLWFVSALVSFR